MQRHWQLKWQPSSATPSRLALVGLGAIGLTAARMALRRTDIRVVAAVETDPQKVGQDLGFLTGWGRTHVTVTDSLTDALTTGQPKVAIVATASRLAEVLPLLRSLVDAGVHVVSSSEELFFPWLTGGEEVWMLHELAKDRKVVVVGGGVNPGFVMDRLPAFIAQACVNVRRIVVRRVVDVATRRPQLKAKLGLGLTPQGFETGVAEGQVGHIGLPQSAAFLAAALGLELSHITETLQPVLNEEGIVKGIEQIASGWEGEYERVRLELRMVLDAPNPCDEMEIDADPPLHVTVQGGVAGDEATAAILVNTATWVDQLPPGVHSGAVWFPPIPSLSVAG